MELLICFIGLAFTIGFSLFMLLLSLIFAAFKGKEAKKYNPVTLENQQEIK